MEEHPPALALTLMSECTDQQIKASLRAAVSKFEEVEGEDAPYVRAGQKPPKRTASVTADTEIPTGQRKVLHDKASLCRFWCCN